MKETTESEMNINADIWDVMRSRHSVRKFTSRRIDEETSEALNAEIKRINSDSGLDFKLVTDCPDVFRGNRPNYGSFSGCKNFFVYYGPKGSDEMVGYYGERLVLYAQSIGLNTCWCALTFEKNSIPTKPSDGMVLHDVIALGYGENQGVPHRSKPLEKLASVGPETPEWFLKGMDAVLLAPTAINQQRFHFEYIGDRGVRAKALFGPCTKTDLGIAKYHFELGAGKDNFEWVE